MNQIDPDLELRAKKASQRIAENMHIIANEPSLALYRLQEHVRKALPAMIEPRVDILKNQKMLKETGYGMEYALGTLQGINENAGPMFDKIHEKLNHAIQLGRKFDESKKRKRYTLDLRDLSDIPVVRETTTRIENIMAHARTTTVELQRSNTTLH